MNRTFQKFGKVSVERYTVGKILRALTMTSGRELDGQSSCGWTGLMWAARYGWHDLVRILIHAGADVAVQDACGISQQLSVHTPVRPYTSQFIKGTSLQLIQSAPVSIARLVNVQQQLHRLLHICNCSFRVPIANSNVPQVSTCS